MINAQSIITLTLNTAAHNHARWHKICRLAKLNYDYKVCLKSNGTGSINVLFYLTSKFYNE